MKKMKLFLAAVLICGAVFAGYAAYERATMTEQEKALLANLEALTDGEINPDCPNGCLDNGGGCLCNGWHSHLKDAGER